MVERTRASLRETSAWRRLEWHLADVRHADLRELFAGDPTRGERLVAEAEGLYLDYSKHLLTDETLELLRKLAAERRLRERALGLLRSEPGEDVQAARHVALRMPRSRSVLVDGVDVVREAHAELDRMYEVAERVRSGSWLGATGKRIHAVVNLATGASELGPALTHEALGARVSPDLLCRFVSNVDPLALATAVDGLDPAETLFVVVQRTGEPTPLANAEAALGWLRGTLGWSAQAGRHLLLVTAESQAGPALEAVPPENVLRLPDWVDESRSLCSAAGLAACLTIGPEGFRELLDGFYAMDEHFATTPLGGNLPAIAGLIGVWYRNFLGAETRVVVPYGESLRLLPAYVRQLTSASGKGVTASGDPVEVETGGIVWGGTGTSAQDAFFQLLHQGTVLSPADFVAVARGTRGDQGRHDLLAANLFAQAEALAFGGAGDEHEDGGEEAEESPRPSLPGNRPSSVILACSLTPATVGSLLAFYEHSVSTQATIWQTDTFARGGGLEYTDELASTLAPELGSGWKHELMHDSSTNALVRRYRRLRDGCD